ncbi:MAG: DNA-3-methyladenine glycosylase I [bacterium]|nr:MAG: DNA-3-methyladenine glycosylase I [bacterium]
MPDRTGLITGHDGALRCWWGAGSPDYAAYHDREWGFPVTDDTRLFEKICLEGFQAGLSWLTILRKRENFRAGIVRHRGKIESTINNARRAVEMAEAHGSLARFFWRFEPGPDVRPRRMIRSELVHLTMTDESKAISKSLKKLRWSFVGPTTMYAFMQAMGLVNDHLEGCHVRPAALAKRATMRVPRART